MAMRDKQDTVLGARKASAEDEAFLAGEAVPEAPATAGEGFPKWFEVTALPKGGEMPDWARGVIPDDMGIERGLMVWIVRMKAFCFRVPRPEGLPQEPVLLLTELTLADEDTAHERSRGKSHRFAGECAKQMIRAIDGRKVIRTGEPGPYSLNEFWGGLNRKGRDLLEVWWDRTHRLTMEESADFLMSSLVIGKRAL